MELSHFKSEFLVFLDRLFDQLETAKIDVSSFEMDHVCWRCETAVVYQSMSDFLETYSDLFHQSIHNGREISLYELHESIDYKGRSIRLIELPSPKSNKLYPSGFEHAEFVLDQALDTWHQQYPLDWDIKNINKTINPDIRLSFGDISAKFHPYSLAYVVKELE